LRQGAEVYAYDFSSRSIVIRRVLSLMRGSTSLWVDIHLGSDVLRATRRHRIWVESRQDWVRAEDLTQGMSVRLLDGRTLEVDHIERVPLAAPQDTYNLHIEEVNNFFAGTSQVLVHNISPARLARLSRGGYTNYVLRNAAGEIYYSGMFGPNDTRAAVERRHAGNHDRYNPQNGDAMEIVAENQTYGEARLTEQLVAEANETVIGRDPNTYRGNRQNPLDASKRAEYADYVEGCA